MKKNNCFNFKYNKYKGLDIKVYDYNLKLNHIPFLFFIKEYMVN